MRNHRTTIGNVVTCVEVVALDGPFAGRCLWAQVVGDALALSRDITERPHAASGVAAFMSANSQTPYITPGMDFPLGMG